MGLASWIRRRLARGSRNGDGGRMKGQAGAIQNRYPDRHLCRCAERLQFGTVPPTRRYKERAGILQRGIL
jgi:hypothetical protein